MTASSTKDFGPIRSDYEFFLDQSTEVVEDIRAYMPHVQSLATAGAPIHMLDFGCGDGRFSAQFLENAGFPRKNLHLSLVEPVEPYRQQLLPRLGSFTDHTLEAWAELPSDRVACFDLVLANHVFYYVPNLDEVVAAIMLALAPSGLFLTAMGGKRNALLHFTSQCFGLIGMPYPYRTAEDLEAILADRQIRFDKEDVHYELVFPDLEKNRISIARFLMGDYFGQVPRQPMIDLFDAHVDGENIAIRILHEHYMLHSDE